MRKIRCEQCPLRGTSLVADLPDAELDAFRACTTIAIYKSRQVIFHAGAPTSGLYFLCHGAVKLYQSDRFGWDHIVAVAGPGEVLGELPSDPSEPYSVSAETLTDSQLCYLPRERLAPFIQTHPMVGVRLISALSAALGVSHKKVRALALKSAESRLADLLIQLAGATGSDGTRLTLRYSRREIAEMIGVSTETAIRLLGRLKRKRAISTSQRELVIADAERLLRIANADSLGAT
ncbi:MAG: putative Fumarate and nitrate reduction regulatory protein [Deltaproteobacteria bacterium]|jgi:CRP/FNR family transcriptional regulator|nr:putative Fumarate and nitrate reduction regulatory protein [Deltaproteobacteria bacterium]